MHTHMLHIFVVLLATDVYLINPFIFNWKSCMILMVKIPDQKQKAHRVDVGV